VVQDPGEFRADCLRRQLGPAAFADEFRAAEFAREPFDLLGRAHVDAVEDGGTQRSAVIVGDEHARSHATHSDRHDLHIRPVEEFSAQLDEFCPPTGSVHLGPSGLGAADLV